MARRCIFCGNSPVSKEHAVPLWAAKLVKADPRFRPPDHVTHTRRTPKRTHEWQGNDVDVTAKCVCAACNNGWMAEIEDRAKPLLTPMILGNRISLTMQEQEAITSWVTLRSLLFRYTSEPVEAPDRDWLEYFREHRLPSPASYAWLAAYRGDAMFHYSSHTLSVIRYPDKPRRAEWETANGINVTFTIGDLIANFLWIRQGKPGNLDPQGFIRVWPTSDTATGWPPSTTWDDAGVANIATRFLSKQ